MANLKQTRKEIDFLVKNLWEKLEKEANKIIPKDRKIKTHPAFCGKITDHINEYIHVNTYLHDMLANTFEQIHKKSNQIQDYVSAYQLSRLLKIYKKEKEADKEEFDFKEIFINALYLSIVRSKISDF